MKSTTEIYKVDRTGWPSGPWDIEPDLFTFEHLEMPCAIIRNDIGTWCGYVAVPRDHSLYMRDYSLADNFVEIHGGLTYSDDHSPHHDPKLNEWWFGFDCAHSDDLMPGMLKYASANAFWSECHYVTMDEVIEETKNLANQLSNLKNENNNPNS